MPHDRPLLARILDPRVPRWVAVSCGAIAIVALVLLVLDPHDNLPMALALLIPAAVEFYGAAAITRLNKKR